MQMQRSVKPFLRCEPTSGSLDLDKPVAFIGDPDMDVCFPINLGVVIVDKSIQQPLLVSGNGNSGQPFVYHAFFDSAPFRQFFPGHAGVLQENPDFSLEFVHARIFVFKKYLARFFLGIFANKKYLLTFVRDEGKNVFAIQ